MLLLAGNGRLRFSVPKLSVLVFAVILLANSVAIRAVSETYYGGPSDSSKASAFAVYEGKLVRRPGEKPEDQAVYLVQKGMKRWVPSSKWIVEHGYRWPEDVLFISPEALAAIPQGPPVE